MEELTLVSEEDDAFERTLLASARSDRMSQAARGRLLAAVASPSRATPLSKRWAPSPTSWMVLAGIVTVAAGSIAGTGTIAHRSDVREAVFLPTAPAPYANESAPSPRPSKSASTPSASKTAPRRSVRTDPPPRRAGASPLGAELELIEHARAAMGAGHAREALDALDEHRARFGSAGALSQEEQILRIEACRLAGDTKQAVSLSLEFLRRHPEGPYSPRVRRLLDSFPRDSAR